MPMVNILVRSPCLHLFLNTPNCLETWLKHRVLLYLGWGKWWFLAPSWVRDYFLWSMNTVVLPPPVKTLSTMWPQEKWAEHQAIHFTPYNGKYKGKLAPSGPSKTKGYSNCANQAVSLKDSGGLPLVLFCKVNLIYNSNIAIHTVVIVSVKLIYVILLQGAVA